MKALLKIFSLRYWCILTFLACKSVFAITPVVYSENTGSTIIGKYVWILNDKSNKLTFDEILVSDQFNKSKSDAPNLGVSSSNFWLLFSVKNESSSSNLLLELAQPTLDKIELYTIFKNGKHTSYKTGEDQPFNQRKYKHPNYIFDLHIPQNTTQTYLMKVIGSEQIILPLTLGKSELIHESIYSKDLISGIFAGIIIIMFIYNLFIYFTTRDESYLYYVAYIILLGLTHMTLQGYTHKYIWPNSTWFIKYSIPLLSSSAGIAALLFVKNFLQTKQYVPILNKIINFSIGVFYISILLSILNRHLESFQLMQINTTLSSLLVLHVGYRVLIKGFRPAKFFMLAWSFLLGGAIVFLLKDFGIIPYNTLTNYSMQFASMIEVALLSFALADRINILKAEKEVAQTEELKQRKENQDILKNQAEKLTIQVNEATEELKTKNDKLEKAYRQVEATKAELIQKEKIAAVGRMAAGMSHGFNNDNTTVKLALGVIQLNTSLHQGYIDYLHEILPQAKNIDTQLQALENYKKEIEYECITDDINGALKRANNGLEKIATNTKKLQDFSKIDSEGWVATSINKDLNNLYDLWRSNLGAIKLRLDLKDIPPLICNAQMMNDCFKNLLQNSIEAIKEKDMPEKEGIISIKTELLEGRIIISFTDNGTGMTEEIKEKAFDLYFTTKGAQKSGTSLTIVKSTITNHDGHVEVDTKVGKGTTIRLIIPVKKRKNK